MAIRECSYLGVPAVNIGTRQQGRERGRNVIDVDHDRAAIAGAIREHRAGADGRRRITSTATATPAQRIADCLATATLDDREAADLLMHDDRYPPDRRAAHRALGYDYAAQPKDAVTRATCAAPTCSSSSRIAIATAIRRRRSACRRCGLVFLNPRMTAAAYGRFYDGVYRPLVSAFHGRLIDAHTIQAEQRDYAARARRVHAPVPRRGAGLRRMLDIGGSTGVVAASLRAASSG